MPFGPQQTQTELNLANGPDSALGLLDAVSFELTLGADMIWLQPHMARVKFGADLPETLLQFTDLFSRVTPRLSAARLKEILPGAQVRWEAQQNETGIDKGRIYEIIIERSNHAVLADEQFTGVVRDITLQRFERDAVSLHEKRLRALGWIDLADFKGQRDLLEKMASDYCPNAVQISFTLKDRERVQRFYGSYLQTHIDYELFRRLVAFLPEAARVNTEGVALLCLLPDMNKIDAESLSQALTAFPISTPDGPVTAALNVKLEALTADVSKAKAKTQGSKNQTQAHPITETDILDLLNQRSLSLALQPICSAASGEVHHYEALMRIDDPSKGPQSAWRHILAAEEMGLVHLLDQRALERAALLMMRYPDVHLALNVSAGTIGDVEKQADYITQIDAYPALHSRMSFEMTETMALGQPDLAAEFAEKLRARGCTLSIDDFGVGHTSFKTLMMTEAHQIKLDGSLIAGICRSADKQNFVRLMVDFADTFNVSIVAERVETAQEKRLLTALGVDYLQGYFLGRPISEHEFNGRMKTNITV